LDKFDNLKGNCQADGYEVIVENYEGQE